MNKERRNKRKLILRERNPDLKIYSPTGQLLYVGKPGFSFNYSDLIRNAKRKYQKPQYSKDKGSY